MSTPTPAPKPKPNPGQVRYASALGPAGAAGGRRRARRYQQHAVRQRGADSPRRSSGGRRAHRWRTPLSRTSWHAQASAGRPSGAALSARSGLRTSAQPRLTRLSRRAGRSHQAFVFDTGGLDNHVALGEHLHPVPVTLLPPLAKGPGGGEVSEEEIAGWLATAAPQFDGLLSQLVPP
jgi:hypothetical protein